MSNHTGDKVDRFNKPNLHQFGAESIYVINDPENIKRREGFVKDWSIFSGFDYTFVDAVMGKDVDIDELISSGRLKTFWCGEGALTPNILGVFQSHLNIWHKIVDEYRDINSYHLILEDDVRLTPYFLDHAYSSGQFSKILKFLHNSSVNALWWGRADKKVTGESYNKLLKVPERFLALGAHGYMITPGTASYLINEASEIQYPLDVFLDVKLTGWQRHYCPNFSYMRQISHMIGGRFFPEDHEHRVWGSTTQPDWFDDTTRDHEGMYRNVPTEMHQYIKSVKEHYLEGYKKGIQFQLKKGYPKGLL